MADSRNVLYDLDINTAKALDHIKDVETAITSLEVNGLASIKKLERAINEVFGGKAITPDLQIDPQVRRDLRNIENAQNEVNESRSEGNDQLREEARLARLAAQQQARSENLEAKRRAAKLRKQRIGQLKSIISGQKKLEKEVQKALRSNPKLAKALHQYTLEHGRLTVRLGGTNRELDEHEKAIRAIIAEYKDVEKVIKRVAQTSAFTGKRGVGTNITPTSFINTDKPGQGGLSPFQIREIGSQLDRLGVQGAGTVGSLTSLFGPLGIAIAGAGLAVAGLITLFVRAGVAGVKAFVNITKAATTVAKETNSVKASLTGLFGSVEAGGQAFGFIRKESERIGANVEELFRRVTPFVGSLDDASRFFDIIAALATLDPAQGIEGATRVAQDALEGNLTPLRKTFALGVDGIREAQHEVGNFEGLIKGLGTELKRRGVDMETLGGTATFTFGRVEQSWRTMQDLMGTPIIDTLVQEANDLLEFFKENEEEFRAFFETVGVSIADVIEKLSGLGIDIGGGVLDPENLQEIAGLFLTIGDSVEAIMAALAGGEDISFSDSIVILESRIQAATEAFIFMSSVIRSIKSIMDSLPIGALAKIAQGPNSGASVELGEFMAGTPLQDVQETAQSVEDIFKNANEDVMDYRESLAGIPDELDAIAESANDVNAELEEQNNALLQLNEATTRFANKSTEYEENVAKPMREAKEGLTQALENEENSQGEKIEDAARDHSEKLLDIAEDAAEKRVDLAKANADKIEDILRKNAQKVEDALRGLDDKEADIERARLRKQEDAERESAKNKIKIEEDYRDKLAEIRRKFDFDAKEAIRANDLSAFLKLQRKLAFDLEGAKQKRDEDVADNNLSEEEKRNKAKQELDRAVEDAKIASERKLRDLQLALERELNERAIAFERELAQAALNEERKREEAEKAFTRQLEDIARSFDRRIEELNKGYAREIQAIKDNNARLIAELKQAEIDKRAAIENMRSLNDGTGKKDDGTRKTRDSRADPLVDLTGDTGRKPVHRRFGGGLSRYQPAIVGEAGEELFVPSVPGTVIPNKHLMFSPNSGGMGGTTNIFNKQGSANISMLDPSTLSQAQIHMVKGIASDVLMAALSGG